MKKMFLVAALFAAAPIFASEATQTPKVETPAPAAAEKGFVANALLNVKNAASTVANSASNAVQAVNDFTYKYTPFSDKFVAANDYVTSTLAAYPKTAVVATAVVVAAVVSALQESEEAEL